MTSFAFVQFEFGFLLGPGDGRFIVREDRVDGAERILALATLGAAQRRLLRGRRGDIVEEAGPELVPTSRATVIRSEGFEDAERADAWLDALRADEAAAGAEVAGGLRVLNRALHAHRAARADHNARDVSDDQALVVRVGHGAGEAVAEGRYARAWELPRGVRRVRRSMEAPDERFAALLGARAPLLACEELVLRARADIDAGRLREAALQARVALEALLAELGGELGPRAAALQADRAAVGAAANEALSGPLGADSMRRLADAVERMESALRARRLRSQRL